MSDLDVIQFMAKAVQEEKIDERWLIVIIKAKWGLAPYGIDTMVPGMVAFKVRFNKDTQTNLPVASFLRLEEIRWENKEIKLVITY